MELFLANKTWGQAAPTNDTASASAGSGIDNRTEQQELRDELKALRSEVERLRAEVENRGVGASGSAAVSAPAPTPAAPAKAGAPSSTATAGTAPANAPAAVTTTSPASLATAPAATATPEAELPKQAKIAPFSDWDWTWLNGNPRTKDAAFDSKFFTPEIRADVNYVYDFNKPKDNSIGGSSELFRSNEIQLEQLGVGGDFHFDNVRARLMTQYGMYSTTTPRNDASPA
jgi:hypothetical protein